MARPESSRQMALFMGQSMKNRLYILHNDIESPADDAALVAALLAYVNGRDVVIRDQEDRCSNEPPELSDVTQWAKRRSDGSADARPIFTDLLRRSLLEPDTLISYCHERWSSDRSYYAISGFFRLDRERGRLVRLKSPSRTDMTDDSFGPENIREDSWLVGFFPYLRELSESIVREPIVAISAAEGYALRECRRFLTVSAALTCGLFALMDETGPFHAALARCKLPRCGRFYLASRKPAGGPANRTYCCPAHRDEHHNSAERRRADRQARRARRTK